MRNHFSVFHFEITKLLLRIVSIFIFQTRIELDSLEHKYSMFVRVAIISGLISYDFDRTRTKLKQFVLFILVFEFVCVRLKTRTISNGHEQNATKRSEFYSLWGEISCGKCWSQCTVYHTFSYSKT